MKQGIIFLLMAILLVGSVHAQAQTQEPTAEVTAQTGNSLFFDDFNYADTTTDFVDHGWIARTADGWPGIPSAIWSGAISIVDDPEQAGNRLVQMDASSDGTTVHQAQFCQQRKFFEGTYATRLRWNDAPISGPDGDNVVETFYTISPLVAPMDPNYSEIDFEYLPNGGWGEPSHSLDVTAWETFSPEPNWIADNTSDSRVGSLDGWHTLVMQVANGQVKYFVDRRLLAVQGGKYYPEVPMSINYNLWFIDGGQIQSSELRQYREQVDWTFHAANTVLSPDQVTAQIEQMRADKISYADSVPPENPPMESPCNF